MKNYLLSFVLVLFAGAAQAQFRTDTSTYTLVELINMELEDLLRVKVTVATKTDVSFEKVPSSVTVITAKEIENMGARELADVLQMVPGFELSKNTTGTLSVGVRGVKDPRFSCKILLLVDGCPANGLFYGSAFEKGYLDDMDNIERIEIIRGPGSAMYGRNAFSAVINIITYTGKTERGIAAKAELGTFNNYGGRLAYGYNKSDLNFHISARILKSDLSDAIDPATNQDWAIEKNSQIINANLGYKGFKFSGTFIHQMHGTWQHFSQDEKTTGRYMLEHLYKPSNKLKIQTRFYGQNSNMVEDIQIVKPNDAIPLGMYVRPQWTEYLYGGEVEANFHLSYNNDLLIGTQADLHGTKDAFIYSNFNLKTGATYPGIGHDNLLKYEPGWVQNNGKDYNNVALYVQDVWSPVSKINITVGARYDYENQIGGVFSPRVGMVWNVFHNSYFKLMYGSAYRSPATSQQYQTSGFALGNPDLKPERINTFEAAFSYRYKKFTSQVNVFHNILTDMIYAEKYITPNVTQTASNRNMGKNSATGIEIENKLFLNDKVYCFMNYTYTKSENTDNFWDGSTYTYQHVDVAPHKLNAGVNLTFFKKINLNTNVMYRSKMKKFFKYDKATDTYNDISQDPVGDYAIINSTLRLVNLFKGFEINVSVYNLLNTKYYSQEMVAHVPEQGNRQVIVRAAYTIRN